MADLCRRGLDDPRVSYFLERWAGGDERRGALALHGGRSRPGDDAEDRPDHGGRRVRDIHEIIARLKLSPAVLAGWPPGP